MLLFLWPQETDSKEYCYDLCRRVFCMFSSRSFLFVCFVFRLTLRSLTHLNLLLYMVWENVWILLFYVLMASFPSTIYKEAIFYPLYMTCLLCHRWAVSVWACFWALYSVPLYFLFCVSPIRFWLLYLCDIAWSQGTWYLQFCYFFSRLFWLFWIILWFHINFRIVCSSSVEIMMGILIGITLNL